MSRIKYPRTSHLPWSEGAASDDKIMSSTDHFLGKHVVVTEKCDGENTTLYRDFIHARSIDSKDHWSRHWVKGFWAGMKDSIPEDYRICGENLYAKHSIEYADLPSYFLGFGAWFGELCLPWDETVEVFRRCGVTPVPVLWRGIFGAAQLRDLAKELDTNKVEGYVVRLASSFYIEQFENSVGKFVRKNHVNTDEHWLYSSSTGKNHLGG